MSVDDETETPRSLGYRLPAEWEPHAATWLAWPHNRDDWPGKFAPIPWVYAEVIRNLIPTEPVHILAKNSKARDQAEEILSRAGVDTTAVHLHHVATDRVWTRDTGPSFVVRDADGSTGLVDWKFNAWAKYDNYKRDAKIPKHVEGLTGFRRWRPKAEIDGKSRRIVLEGGSIDTDGRGTMLTTEECLLDDVQARNPGLGREGIERAFADYLGISRTIWLNQGIAGDDTHGHVDDLARFVAPGVVALALEDDPADANYGPTQENLVRLQNDRGPAGETLEIITLPMPAPLYFEGQRLPASYANFYIANGVVLVPTFNDPADREALGILAEAFSDRRVVGIHAVDLVWGLGTLHCMTRDQPMAGVE